MTASAAQAISGSDARTFTQRVNRTISTIDLRKITESTVLFTMSFHTGIGNGMSIALIQPDVLCDFCSSPKTMTRYRAQDFIVDMPGPVQESVGDWAACELCTKMIDTANWDALLDHAVASLYEANPEMQDEMPPEFVRANLSQMYSQLRRANFHKVEG